METKSWISASRKGDGMKTLIISILIVAMVFVSGCCGATPQAPNPTETGTPGVNIGNPSADGNANASPPANASQPPPPVTGDGTIVDVGNSTTSTTPPVEDCSTLSPTCNDCIVKSGCGWCKSSATCFHGTASGPSGDVTCQQGDWATTSAACAGPVGGSACSSKTNCADCLSGSGCQWCQEGTKCTDIGSSDSCGSGGWRTKSYQCYGGQ